MYSEEEEKKGLPIRDFLIKLILVILFVLLLVWLLPMPDLTGLNNRIFNANVQEMKNAAVSYFTTERLPKNVGDKVTLTLQEMLDMHLLLPFTDKNGNACDTENSYVTLEKLDTEYELKVNLKCNDEEDHIVVKMGCYDYCDSDICEKNEPKDPVPEKKPEGPECTLTVSSGTAGANNWYRSNVVVKFKSRSTTTKGATITDYGIGTSKNYNKGTSYEVKKDGSTTVYGYVKDSTGKEATCSVVVKKDTVKPTCELGVLSGSKASNGNYITDVVVGFKSRTDAASGVSAYGVTTSKTVTYNGKDRMTISSNGKYTVYGYVRDAAGNTNTCSVVLTREASEKDSIPSCSLEILSGTKGSNGWYVSNVDVGFKSKTTTNGATITGFGLGTSENYNGGTKYTVKNDGKYTIYGYVKDSNGHTATCSIEVKKDATAPNCSLEVKSGTLNSNGYYTSDVVVGFKSRNDAMSGVGSYGIGTSTNYNGGASFTVSANGKHTVEGYIKDNAGNVNKCSISVEKRDTVYEYQYQKHVATEYSNWSEWKTQTYSASNPPKFGKYALIEIEDLGKSSVFDRWQYSVGDPITKTEVIETGRVTEKSCKGYSYYRLRTETTTTTYAVRTGGGWKYEGMVSLKGAPQDNLATRYEYVGADFDRCGSSCNTTPYTTWQKYTRDVGTVQTSSNGTTITFKDSKIVTECNEYETKETVLFNTITKIVGYNEIRNALYKDVYQYRTRTRTVVKDAYTDYKWSVYNDQSLLNQGYTMNGNKRVAS